MTTGPLTRRIALIGLASVGVSGTAHAEEWGWHRHHRRRADQTDRWDRTDQPTEHPTDTTEPATTQPKAAAPAGTTAPAATATPTTTETTAGATSTLPAATDSATFAATLPNPSGGDDTSAINKTLASVPSGSAVYAPGGNTWNHNDVIQIPSGVTLQGNGDTSIFHATDTLPNPQMAVALNGAKAGLIAVKLTTAYPTGQGMSLGDSSGAGYRSSQPFSHAVYIAPGATDAVIDHVHSIGGASGGIYSNGGSGHQITNNTVEYPLADGIGLYSGAANILVQNNTVTGAGDDGISIVCYSDGPQSTAIVITGNTVSGGYWGRGIADIGSKGTKITNNAVVGTYAAGIWVAQDSGVGTYAPVNGIADSNTVSNCAQPGSGYMANYQMAAPIAAYTLTNNTSLNPIAGDYHIDAGCNVTTAGNQPAGTGA